jgi:beta-glucosidase
VVVILLSGRPLIITDALNRADAFVAAWLPGTEGEGVADVLFGDVPFTGRLSYTWPRSIDQIPFDFANLPTEGCDAPLFPYGYGLDAENTDTTWVELAKSCAGYVEEEPAAAPVEAQPAEVPAGCWPRWARRVRPTTRPSRWRSRSTGSSRTGLASRR